MHFVSRNQVNRMVFHLAREVRRVVLKVGTQGIDIGRAGAG